MAIVWAAVFLAECWSTAASADDTAADPRLAKIEAYLSAAEQHLGFSGSVLVRHEGKVLVSRGLRQASIELEVPNTPRTRFRIGSITKSFTALLILQQVEAGKLALEDSICKHLDHPPEAWQPVTVHHLLCHTGGIFNYTDSLEWLTKQAVLTNPEKLLPIFRDKPLRFTPGEKHEYSNSGYVLLGMILHRVTGKHFETLLREQITEPLGMADTGYDHPLVVLPRRAAGYSHFGKKTQNARYLDMASTDTAGAMISTVEDLAKYDEALTEGRLLSAASYEKLFTPVIDNYAYGWVVEDVSGGKLIWHNGGINGFASSLLRRPHTRSCVIVLSNFDDGPSDQMAREIMALLHDEEYRLPRTHEVAAVDPAGYDDLVGEYELAPGAVLTITRQGDQLKAQLTGQPRFEVFPESESEFFCRVVDAQLSFFRDEKGKATHLVLHQGGRHLKAGRLTAEKTAGGAAAENAEKAAEHPESQPGPAASEEQPRDAGGGEAAKP